MVVAVVTAFLAGTETNDKPWYLAGYRLVCVHRSTTQEQDPFE